LRVSEVGPYALHVEDSSWAMVDFPNGDCDINSSHVSDDPKLKVWDVVYLGSRCG